jgi:hypothetical protein
VNIAEALAEYDRQYGENAQDRLAFLRGNKTGIRRACPHLVHTLDEWPQVPKIAWIVRPPNFQGDDTIPSAILYEKAIMIGEAVFLKGSGRAASGRNALRHGRIDWAETRRRYGCWHLEVDQLSKDYTKAIREIELKWSLWFWDQEPFPRGCIQHGGSWYALKKTDSYWVVHNSHLQENLHWARPEVFYSVAHMLQQYPFLKTVCDTLGEVR